MHSTLSTYLKRALTVALILGPTLALVSAEVEARRGGGGRGGGVGGGHEIRAPRGNVGGGGRDINRGDYNRRDVNVNRDVNINRNVDVDVDRHWGYPVGAGAVAVGTAVAVGAIVSTLPPSCSTFVADRVHAAAELQHVRRRWRDLPKLWRHLLRPPLRRSERRVRSGLATRFRLEQSITWKCSMLLSRLRERMWLPTGSNGSARRSTLHPASTWCRRRSRPVPGPGR